jgi:hypothetical protein
MARRGNRWTRQAALEALLRFGPELSGLKALQREAEGQFRSSVHGARATARGTVQAVRGAKPEVRDIYHDARHATKDIGQVIGPDMAGVPASLQAAISQETTGFRNRMAESQAAALTDLTQQRVAAQAGKGAAIRSARDEFANQIQQVLQRRLDLAQEQGAYTSLRVGELRQEAQKRADQFALKQMGLTQSERNSIRSSGIDPNTGKPIPGGRLDPKTEKGKKGRATRAQIGSAQDTVGLANSWVTRLRHAGLDRHDIAQVLLSGRESSTVQIHDPSTGKPVYNPDGTPKTKKVSAVPKIASQLLLSATLDQHFGGYVSEATRRKLHRRGIYLTDLGLVNLRDYRRKNKPRPHGGPPSSGAGGYPYGPGSGSVH